jgi:hypothetical protein
MTFDEGPQIQPAAHIEDHDLALYVFDRLGQERSSSIKSHVGVCTACKDKLVAGFLTRLAAVNNAAERRTEGRLQGGEQGYLQTLSPLSFDRPTVQIIDVSHGGWGLRMNSSLATGIIVQVSAGTASALGEVRYCLSTDHNQFRVGIRMQTRESSK